jgi:hypothetical protein
MDSTEEVTGSLVLAGGEAAILSELVEEWLDQVPRPIQMLVIITRLFAAPLEWNRNAFVHILQGIDDSRLGIEAGRQPRWDHARQLDASRAAAPLAPVNC